MLPLETKESGGKLLPHSDLRAVEGGKCFFIEGKIEERIEVTGRRGDEEEEVRGYWMILRKRGYWKLK
jgi:hypothetical protein